ncbi:MAG: phosphate system positive regulatory protein pho81 [Caeruleum heppii]|nr:MAG: phosphate system positive regulatory protein pho81 [Caeruleum heppii]
MTRITPRTCLYPLTGSLLLTFGLSMGLTFRSNHYCYAGVCGEWLFPLAARLHVLVWYLWISLSVTFLAFRAFSPTMRRRLRTSLVARKLPLVQKHLSLSGVLVVSWVVILYAIVIGIWWLPLRKYFVDRGDEGGVNEGNHQLAAIALTGHFCDITMGMTLIPISRNSALASFFKLSVSTTRAVHMICAYALFALILIHAFLYISWVPIFNALNDTLRTVYPVLNPTYLYHETWPGLTSSLGIWRASLIFTGIASTTIFVLIFLTTLPIIRAKHYNVFYFTHLSGILAVVIICLHASTMFYCTAPGVAMWILDWGMRAYELKRKLDGEVTTIGNGWYCLSLPLPRPRLHGCACTSPLAHFYIHHAESSIRELHPFTTITHLASQNAITVETEDDFRIQFLFRKSGREPESPTETSDPIAKKSFAQRAFTLRKRKPPLQWTNRLAGLVDRAQTLASTSSPEHNTEKRPPFPIVPIPLRLEGPYFTPAAPTSYRTVICVVAGTGISGALAIASFFAEIERQRAEGATESTGCRGVEGAAAKRACAATGGVPGGGIWDRCVILWSVRESDFVELPFLDALPPTSKLTLRPHLTGPNRSRLNIAAAITEIVDENVPSKSPLETSASSIVSRPISPTFTATTQKDAADAIPSTSLPTPTPAPPAPPPTTTTTPGSKCNSVSASTKLLTKKLLPATLTRDPGRREAPTWVYLSGPNGFIDQGEKACKEVGRGVEWKFGKHLQKRQLDIPEYAASFVNYKALKKLIKKLSATPVLRAQHDVHLQGSAALEEPQATLQANKATFFFRLERELEKVNTFYLQKEAELKLRLQTLLDKKKVMQSRSQPASKVSTNFISLEEGFQQFGNDLNKLQEQQFVEINATAFSKILKKWDKTSKSRTKELYLSRAVEVQPCFNRDVISELSDQATTSLLELGAWAEGEKVNYGGREASHITGSQQVGTDESEADSQFLEAANTGNLAPLRDWIGRLNEAPDGASRTTRTFLAAVAEAPDASLELLLQSGLVDLQSADEINERSCLHEAAISGRILVLRNGLSGGVDVTRADVYGRLPLHYVCMHGRIEMLEELLRADRSTLDALDHDNFTPLIHAVVHHQNRCVERLLAHGARIDPISEADHIPLNLACQHDSFDIVQLLLSNHARVLADAEGLFPQHLVARSGRNPQLLLLLSSFGADLDEVDKLNQWTPLFHAASEGKEACVQILLEHGARIDILDEKDLPAMYYAAWEGRLACMALLASAGGTSGPARMPTSLPSQTLAEPPVDSMSMDGDGIPDLSLPPPIIPLRRYGHNFLDNKTFVQISLDAVVFYHDSKYPAARLTISSKLSDLIPRNVLLPISDDTRIISFQIDRLDSFAIDFDIFPTFGSKIIAKTVALSSVFGDVASSAGHCCLPLFDPRLRAIGQIGFSFQIIKPFAGTPLEITDFATYWKATSQFDTHPNALITGFSLSGEYVRMVVQLTSDSVPVLYPFWEINHAGIDFPVSRLTYRQFKEIGSQQGKGRNSLDDLSNMRAEDVGQACQTFADSFVSLQDALTRLPSRVNLDIHILYPTAAQEGEFHLAPTDNLNYFVDSVLRDVFDHARACRERSPDAMRSIMFSSYNPNVCTAINWKQPNYPVFLCNDLGRENPTSSGSNPTSIDLASSKRSSSSSSSSSGGTSMSVKEAVRIAQSNNFMGLICRARLLDMVPALIESIKVAGLVLVTDTTREDSTASVVSSSASKSAVTGFRQGQPDGIDGVLRGNGVLRFHETIDM